MSAPKFFFIFPVFNEEPNIPTMIDDLGTFEDLVRPLSSEIKFVFVDDGSTDKTVEYLRSAKNEKVEILEHKTNRGPGAAFQTGFSTLLALGLKPDDVVITLEGDATSNPKVLKRMLKRMEEGDDLILASPYLYGGGFQEVQFYRVLISHVANGLIKLLLNLRGLSTFSCFFRLYRGSALIAMAKAYPQGIVTCYGFDCAVEILVKATRLGLLISEIPFQVDWTRRKGKSKMKIFKTAIQYLKLMWRFNAWRSGTQA